METRPTSPWYRDRENVIRPAIAGLVAVFAAALVILLGSLAHAVTTPRQPSLQDFVEGISVQESGDELRCGIVDNPDLNSIGSIGS